MRFPLLILAFSLPIAAQEPKPTTPAPKRGLVRIYADTGRDAAAIRLAKEILATEPGDTDTALTLAKLYSTSNEHREAADVLAKALENSEISKEEKVTILKRLAGARRIAKDDLAARKAWLACIDLLDDSTEKAAAYEQLGFVEEAPRNVRAFEASAALFRKFGQPLAAARLDWNISCLDGPQSLSAIRRYLETKPVSVAPYVRYAELLRKEGPVGNAEAVLETLSAGQPEIDVIRWVLNAESARHDFPTAHIRFLEFTRNTTREEYFELLVRTYSERRKAVELLVIAEELFPVLPEKMPTVPTDLSKRQQAFVKALGQAPEEFVRVLIAAVRNGRPRSAQLWELLAWLADRAGQPDDLEQALRRSYLATGRDPLSTAFEKLTAFLSRHRKWDELLALCDTIRDFDAYMAVIRSEALCETGRGSEALRILKAQKVANFAIHRNTAHVLGTMGRYTEMLKLLNEMLHEFKTVQEVRGIRLLRAESFLGLDRFDEMETELRGLLEADPDDVLVLNNLGYNLADKNRKLVEAESLIRYALEIDRRARIKAGDVHLANAAYLDSLGWVLFRRGCCEEARKYLEQASELSDGKADALVWDHLGDVYFRLGNTSAAKAAWRNADDRYQNNHRGRQQGRQDEVKRKLKLIE